MYRESSGHDHTEPDDEHHRIADLDSRIEFPQGGNERAQQQVCPIRLRDPSPAGRGAVLRDAKFPAQDYFSFCRRFELF